MPDAVKTTAPLSYPPEPRGLNAFEADRNLQAVLRRRAPALLAAHGARLADFGAWVAGALDAQAAYSDRYAPPRLEAYNRLGDRDGRVVLNPAYQACHEEAYRRGVVGLAYGADPAPHALSFTMGYLLATSDISIHCPVTMTGAVAYVLSRMAPAAVRETYLPELVRMDGRAQSGGTWATEQHGGSDVGATTTRARRDGAGWRLDGLKWFTSNAGGGLALATARPEGAPDGPKGLGCYLVPERLPDGTRNALWIRRLKDKLGTRALPTGEIELEGAWALEVAPPPEGLKAMMEALEYSRIHNAVAACGVQRRAFLEAICWASHRVAFGQTIRSYPMVRETLLDLMAELEASTALAFEAAFAFDAASTGARAGTWLRTATALAKYHTAEAGLRAAAHAIEVIGGNGYTEDWPTARLFRDAMVLPVWEGPPNIQALELLRVACGPLRGDEAFLGRTDGVLAAVPPALAATGDLVRAARDRCAASLRHLRGSPDDGPRHARRLLTLMADTLSAALLVEEAAADLAAGDSRKALIAHRYARRCLGGGLVIDGTEDPAQRVFERVVGYAPIAS